MDTYYVQSDLGGGRDKFCTLHSALMASLLYDYFEKRQRSPKKGATPVAVFRDVYLQQYIRPIYEEGSAIPLLHAFLQRLRKAEVRSVNAAPKQNVSM